jgi:hypothetical protein
MPCHYDTSILKSLDIFSAYGFPVSLIQSESNRLVIKNGGGSSVVVGGISAMVSLIVPSPLCLSEDRDARLTVFVGTAYELLSSVVPVIENNPIHHLDNVDIAHGITGIKHLSDIGIPCAMHLKNF